MEDVRPTVGASRRPNGFAAHPARRLHVHQARRTASRCPRRRSRRGSIRRRVGCSGELGGPKLAVTSLWFSPLHA